MIKKFFKYTILLLSLFATCILVSCDSSKSTMSGGFINYYVPPATTTTSDNYEGERYNRTDTAVVISVDTTNEKITFQSVSGGKNYYLYYSGGTEIYGEEGSSYVISQISVGEVVDLYYISGTQKLVKMQVSPDYWRNSNGVRLSLNEDKAIITFGGSTYTYDSDLVVMSGGASIDVSEILKFDEFTAIGKDNKIYSIIINKGHGYVKFTDGDDFIDGIIEVGAVTSAVIEEEEMVLAVPEGTYTVYVSSGDNGGSAEVTVEKDETIPLSLLQFKKEGSKTGLVNLVITPDDAVVYIDDIRTDYSEKLTLSYGTHTIEVTSTEYDSYEGELVIDSAYSTFNIDLTATSEDETDSDSDSDDTTTTTTIVDSDHYIYITCLTSDATVYFDGVSSGTSPVVLQKVTGTHTIILVADGYETASYTIEIEDDDADVVKVYPALTAEDDE